MQTDALGPLLRLEVTADGIGDHRVQFRERVSLRGDAATVARRVPARDVAAGFRARRDLENYFSNRAHAGKLSAMRFGVNTAKPDLPPGKPDRPFAKPDPPLPEPDRPASGDDRVLSGDGRPFARDGRVFAWDDRAL